jgi:hypothetical protein
VSLSDLTELLGRYAAGEISLESVQQTLTPVLLADPLGAEHDDSAPWDADHRDARLFWRLVYLIESETEDGDRPRVLVGRILRCLADTRSAESTHELFPLLLDQERFCGIVAKYRAGLIARTGFLSVLVESGYPAHVKLWLEHAPPVALARLCAGLGAGRYEEAAAGFEAPPA